LTKVFVTYCIFSAKIGQEYFDVGSIIHPCQIWILWYVGYTLRWEKWNTALQGCNAWNDILEARILCYTVTEQNNTCAVLLVYTGRALCTCMLVRYIAIFKNLVKFIVFFFSYSLTRCQKLNTLYGEPWTPVACYSQCLCRDKLCGGCKRVGGERPHSFMVVFSGSPDLTLSASTEEEMLDWTQALCEAVVGKKVCARGWSTIFAATHFLNCRLLQTKWLPVYHVEPWSPATRCDLILEGVYSSVI